MHLYLKVDVLSFKKLVKLGIFCKICFTEPYHDGCLPSYIGSDYPIGYSLGPLKLGLFKEFAISLLQAMILESGIFPDIWNISTISTLHKSGSLYDCNNYRGISIGSCLGKLFTKILQYRMSSYQEEKQFN